MVEVIPSEIVLAYGGYLISLGKISFIGARVDKRLLARSIARWFYGLDNGVRPIFKYKIR